MFFDPKTIGWRHHYNCIIIMPLGHYATLLQWLRIFDATDLYHTSVADPGYPWGRGANPPGHQHTILPNFPKTAWKWKNLDPRGGGMRSATELYQRQSRSAVQFQIGCSDFRAEGQNFLFWPSSCYNGRLRVSLDRLRFTLGLASLKYLVTDTSLDFSLQPFRIVFLHQFLLLSDTVTFHLCSVVEERITSNVVRLTMSW